MCGSGLMTDPSFNPRLRAGGDPRARPKREVAAVFQPTPPRGRRHASSAFRAVSLEFQPTPPRGRRQPLLRPGHAGVKFQPTPPRGRRLGRSDLEAIEPFSFNPRLRAGGD